MMKPIAKLSLALGLVVALVLGMNIISNAQSWKTGAKAPDFSGKGSDGKTHTLKSLTGKKPLVLYFIGHTCPINAQAVTYYNRVATAYKGKVNFVGVIDTDAAGYKAWQNQFKAPYPVIFDKDLKIIRSYKAERSPWTILVSPQGNIQKVWEGYSIGEINELSASIAGATKSQVAKIDTTGAPKNPRAG